LKNGQLRHADETESQTSRAIAQQHQGLGTLFSALPSAIIDAEEDFQQQQP
jgi:hypothetical protein